MARPAQEARTRLHSPRARGGPGPGPSLGRESAAGKLLFPLREASLPSVLGLRPYEGFPGGLERVKHSPSLRLLTQTHSDLAAVTQVKGRPGTAGDCGFPGEKRPRPPLARASRTAPGDAFHSPFPWSPRPAPRLSAPPWPSFLSLGGRRQPLELGLLGAPTLALPPPSSRACSLSQTNALGPRRPPRSRVLPCHPRSFGLFARVFSPGGAASAASKAPRGPEPRPRHVQVLAQLSFRNSRLLAEGGFGPSAGLERHSDRSSCLETAPSGSSSKDRAHGGAPHSSVPRPACWGHRRWPEAEARAGDRPR